MDLGGSKVPQTQTKGLHSARNYAIVGVQHDPPDPRGLSHGSAVKGFFPLTSMYVITFDSETASWRGVPVTSPTYCRHYRHIIYYLYIRCVFSLQEAFHFHLYVVSICE